MSDQKRSIVIGDGWAALGAVSFQLQAGKPVCWISGTGGRMLPAVPSFEAGVTARAGLEAWTALARNLGIDCGELQTGSFLREFRNKAFREPAWTKAPTVEARLEVRNETLWAPECRFGGAFDARLGLTAGDIDEAIRKRLMTGEIAGLERIENLPVTGFKLDGSRVTGVILGSGREIEGDSVIFADRWTSIAGTQGLPQNVQKAISSTRKLQPVGVLQAIFNHESPMALGVEEGFYVVLNKEAGEEIERHVWGYFSSDGLRSFWTICLAHDEGEDNHQITKKLRRMKSALDKIFSESSWLPQGKTDFMSTVTSEQVRFEELMVYGGSSPEDLAADLASALKKIEGISFLTDGFGPTEAMKQVATLFGLVSNADVAESSGPESEAKDVNLGGPALDQ